MAVEWRWTVSPCLETQPWTTLVLDGKNYLVKGLFASDSYHLLVTDLAHVWEENMKDKELLDRSKVRG